MKLRTALFCLFAAAFLVAGSASPLHAVDKGPISTEQLQALIQDTSSTVVLVNFWSTWCGPCRKEIPGLIELRDEYPESDIAILGISLDYNPKTVAAFNKKLGINYPIYMASPDVMRHYQIEAIPRMLIYTSDGLINDHEGYMPTSVLRDLVEELVGKPGGN